VGTEYFQKLEKLPFGYADERNTTREEYFAILEELKELDLSEEREEDDDD
jgi:hypothetical protein